MAEHEEGVEDAGEKEAEEPGVVVEEGEGGDDAAYEGGEDACGQGEDGDGVEAFAVLVGAVAVVEGGEVEAGAADEEVVGDHDAGYWAEEAGVADEPAEDVAAEGGHEFPRHHG